MLNKPWEDEEKIEVEGGQIWRSRRGRGQVRYHARRGDDLEVRFDRKGGHLSLRVETPMGFSLSIEDFRFRFGHSEDAELKRGVPLAGIHRPGFEPARTFWKALQAWNHWETKKAEKPTWEELCRLALALDTGWIIELILSRVEGKTQSAARAVRTCR